MADPRSYADAAAFRRALEDHLLARARAENLDLQRLYRMVAFERFLGRVCLDEQPLWLLKGGYAMEVRLRMDARATKDLDLSLPDGSLIAIEGQANPEQLLKQLRETVAKDLGDSFRYTIGDAVRDMTGAPYGGWRFQVEATLAARRFSEFKLDIGVGDAVVAKPEWMQGHDLLSFAGIAPVRIALLPRDQHFAEKIHAYTLPRDFPNSRVRDLVDLVLLIQGGLPETPAVQAAIVATFARRKTHEVPVDLKEPPAEWEKPYRSLASDVALEPAEIGAAFEIVNRYWQKLDFGRKI